MHKISVAFCVRTYVNYLYLSLAFAIMDGPGYHEGIINWLLILVYAIMHEPPWIFCSIQ